MRILSPLDRAENFITSSKHIVLHYDWLIVDTRTELGEIDFALQ